MIEGFKDLIKVNKTVKLRDQTHQIRAIVDRQRVIWREWTPEQNQWKYEVVEISYLKDMYEGGLLTDAGQDTGRV